MDKTYSEIVKEPKPDVSDDVIIEPSDDESEAPSLPDKLEDGEKDVGLNPDKIKKSVEKLRRHFEAFQAFLTVKTAAKHEKASASLREQFKAANKSNTGSIELGLLYIETTALIMRELIWENEGSPVFLNESPENWRFICNHVLDLILKRKPEEESNLQPPGTKLLMDVPMKKQLDQLIEGSESKKMQELRIAMQRTESEIQYLNSCVSARMAEVKEISEKLNAANNSLRFKNQLVKELEVRVQRQQDICDSILMESEDMKLQNENLERQALLHKEEYEAAQKDILAFLEKDRRSEIAIGEYKSQIKIMEIAEEDRQMVIAADKKKSSNQGSFKIDYTSPRIHSRTRMVSDPSPDRFLLSRIPNLLLLQEENQHDYYHGLISDLLIHYATLEYHVKKGTLHPEPYEELKKTQMKSGIWIPDAFAEYYELAYKRVECVLEKEAASKMQQRNIRRESKRSEPDPEPSWWNYYHPEPEEELPHRDLIRLGIGAYGGDRRRNHSERETLTEAARRSHRELRKTERKFECEDDKPGEFSRLDKYFK